MKGKKKVLGTLFTSNLLIRTLWWTIYSKPCDWERKKERNGKRQEKKEIAK